MNESDGNGFKSVLIGIGSLYDKRITPDIVSVYWGAFSGITLEAFKAAVSAHTLDPDQGMFFPKPAHLMRHITGTIKQNQQAVDDKAELAWSQIMGEVQNKGPYSPLEIDDGQAVAAVKAMGGWIKLCGMTYEQMVWAKKEFFSIYETCERTPIEALPSSLPGLIELQHHKSEEGRTLSVMLDEVKKRLEEK